MSDEKLVRIWVDLIGQTLLFLKKLIYSKNIEKCVVSGLFTVALCALNLAPNWVLKLQICDVQWFL